MMTKKLNKKKSFVLPFVLKFFLLHYFIKFVFNQSEKKKHNLLRKRILAKKMLTLVLLTYPPIETRI